MPVLAGHDRLRVTALVDRDEARARQLARAYNVSRVLSDLDALHASDVDGVVLATPPAHHAPATIALVSRGIHVFAEKPLATTAADAHAMVTAAEQHGMALSVGLYRRMLPAVQLLRRMLENGDFGRPLSVDIEEGGAYGWQLTTLAILTAAAGGGGTLIDIGSHVIDLILFALPGTATLVAYEDNSRGGVETDCVARFTITTDRDVVPVRLELSRTRELRGSIRVQCENGTLELLRGNFTELRVLQPRDRATDRAPSLPLIAQAPGAASFCGYDAFRAQIDDWVNAIVTNSTPALSGRSVLPVVQLIEDCYQHRTLLKEPWVDEGFTPTTNRPSRRRQKVLVTGAGGFLGGRTVELLAGRYGYEVAPLVKEPRSAARLARWPIEILLGDVCSPEDMDRAMRGCDAVVHCAVGTSWKANEVYRVTVDGTRTVAEAALRAGVSRFVHISSMAVHQPDVPGALDESVPLEPKSGDTYGRNKLLAEQHIREAGSRGLPGIILRPARIYGPFSKTFTVRPLQALSEGHLAISGDPDVPANMVYVDNVVEAIATALEAPDTFNGASYLINDSDQLSLRGFFDYFGQTFGASVRLVEAPPSDIHDRRSGALAHWWSGFRTIVLSPEVRALVHRIMDTDPIGTIPRRLWEGSPGLQSSLLRLFRVDAAVVYRPAPGKSRDDLLYYGGPALVSSAKAERELGFHPIVNRERAMALTLEWAQHARLVPCK